MFIPNEKFYLLSKTLRTLIVSMRDGDAVRYGVPGNPTLTFLRIVFEPSTRLLTVYQVSPTGRLYLLLSSKDTDYVATVAMRLVERCTAHDIRQADPSQLTWFLPTKD